jgi:hypothetical protein
MKLGLNLCLNKSPGGYSKETRDLCAKTEDIGLISKDQGVLKQNNHAKGYRAPSTIGSKTDS